MMINSVKALTSNQLLCNRHYVERIDRIGKETYDDWDIDAYLCGKMGPGEYRPKINIEAIDCSDIAGLTLNRSEDEYYGYELFLKPIRNWPLRGAPFFWCEMARELTDDILPLGDCRIDEVVQKLKTEYGIPDSGEEWILVPKYHKDVKSGISSGAVFADGINEIMEEIKQRNSMYAELPKAFVEQYVRRFDGFPYLID